MSLAVLLLVATVATTPVTAHRPVATTVPLAQQRFDTGLTQLYAYAGDASAFTFTGAALSDPHLAIAFWGMALADGSDLNTGLTEERFAAAQRDIGKAQALETFAPADDRSLIDAVALRYAGTFADQLSDETRYENAMRAYVVTHANDDDAAMLLVEALLEYHGMHWNPDSTPRDPISIEMLRLTQGVLARTPTHLFANHLCIHIYDNAPDRTPAVPCAQFLDAQSFAAEDEHLAHMPAHTWIERGDGRRADASSERAWQLHPARYAQHDAYVGLLGAVYDGSVDRVTVWMTRYAAFGVPLPLLVPSKEGGPDMVSILAASASERRGDIDAAAADLRSAIAAQRSRDSTEIQPLVPADIRLGALFYRAARYADAASAFTDVLAHRPEDPRGLFGMWQTLVAQGRAVDAAPFAQHFQANWAGGPLTMNDF